MLLTLPVAGLLGGCAGETETVAEAEEPLEYPVAYQVEQTDNYFGTEVADPYRWMEDEQHDSLRPWIVAQQELFETYMERIPYQEPIQERLTELWNYEKYSAPFRAGENWYYFHNTGLQNQSVIYQMDDMEGEPRVFLDPNTFSEGGTVALSALDMSKDGKYAAYGIAKSGSDWNEFYVMDTESGEQLSDTLNWIKFSGIAWDKDGFYYSRYAEPSEETKLTSKNVYHKVYYHKLGTPQSEDVLVHQNKEEPNRNFYASTTEDEEYLVISASEGASGNNMLLVKNLEKPNAKLQPLVNDFESQNQVIGVMGPNLLVRTDYEAPKYRLVLVNPANPARENWITVIPEQENEVLQSADIVSKRILTTYMKDASSRLYVFDQQGNKTEVGLPTLGTASGFGGKKEDSVIFYTFTSFTYPPTIFKYDMAKNSSEVYREADVAFNPDDYKTEQVFYTSKDGTKVPMFITYKKGIELNGRNPALLYGYGGFNISINPRFSTSNILFLEQGGVYAVANIRGGGEYGAEWHEAGTKLQKQNVFDDFIAAAEYLVDEQYTSADKLAIEGGSNGGLLVGATMIQRPDLFAVAIPHVGVMDMLRFQHFTIGRAWTSDYGSAEDSAQFQALYAYSPVHNLEEGECYPATLVITADHDDRVVPAHSFKFTARLQEVQSCANPTLIRIETKAGHGAGKPTSKQIEEAADKWAFTFYNLKMDPTFAEQATTEEASR